MEARTALIGWSCMLQLVAAFTELRVFLPSNWAERGELKPGSLSSNSGFGI